MLYFAKLDGYLVGIDHYCRFEAKDEIEAQEIADGYAEENYAEFDDPFDEDDDPRFYAKVEPWNEEKHGEYIGQACFTDYTVGG